MRIGIGIAAAAFLLLAPHAFADPVTFHPDGCDFEIAFPAAPTISQTKTKTSRGDDVVTDRASLSLDVDGKANYFRAECTRIKDMGFVDEDVLKNVMSDLGSSYKLENTMVSLERSGKTGPIGKLHGKGKVGGKEMLFDIRRYTQGANIFDVWIGAEPDGFPTAAGTAFVQGVKLNGENVK